MKQPVFTQPGSIAAELPERREIRAANGCKVPNTSILRRNHINQQRPAECWQACFGLDPLPLPPLRR